jgi:hypothetical protein
VRCFEYKAISLKIIDDEATSPFQIFVNKLLPNKISSQGLQSNATISRASARNRQPFKELEPQLGMR